MDMKTEADSNDISEVSHDDKSTTGMFVYSCSLWGKADQWDGSNLPQKVQGGYVVCIKIIMVIFILMCWKRDLQVTVASHTV